MGEQNEGTNINAESQEKELTALGVTRMMRRNIVIGNYAGLILIIVGLSGAIAYLYQRIERKNEEIRQCEQRFSEEIRQLKSEMIQYLIDAQGRIDDIESRKDKRSKK